jgi:hypothetical protein
VQKKALVAAKAWVSLYRKLEKISNLGGVIIHTSKSKGQKKNLIGYPSQLNRPPIIKSDKKYIFLT